MGLNKQTVSFQKDNLLGPDNNLANAIPAISPLYTDMVHRPVNKDRRILVQGILQAVIQSQGLLLEPNNGYINKVKETTLDLVKFVEENSK